MGEPVYKPSGYFLAAGRTKTEISGAEKAFTNAHGPQTVYRVGERIHPDEWDENWMEECSHGIHFYITRLEAENH